MSGNTQKYGWSLSWKVEAFWFKKCVVLFILITFGNMFLENGNMFLVNGKPFLDKSQISCGFLKYAWCIFKATPVRPILPNAKTYYHFIKITYKKKKTKFMHNRLVP